MKTRPTDTQTKKLSGTTAVRPQPLEEPALEDLRLETVLAALADPLRLTIAQKLMLESDAYDHPCGWFGFDRPKSSLTHHFKTLREAGVIRQRQYGLERRSQLRHDDLQARFPGLLALVENWQPTAGSLKRRESRGDSPDKS